jgi:poly(A) polymerase
MGNPGPCSFLYSFRHFVVLVASSKSPENQLEWHGLVESKIRLLIATLEGNPVILRPHIWPISYPPVNTNAQRNCSQWFIGLKFGQANDLDIDLTHDISAFIERGKGV